MFTNFCALETGFRNILGEITANILKPYSYNKTLALILLNHLKNQFDYLLILIYLYVYIYIYIYISIKIAGHKACSFPKENPIGGSFLEFFPKNDSEKKTLQTM